MPRMCSGTLSETHFARFTFLELPLSWQGEADRFEATQRTAPKLRRITDGGLLELVEVDASKELSALLDELRVQLDAGAFTGRGDKDVVMAML